jgi:twitching motility two-component system response regulator PilH
MNIQKILVVDDSPVELAHLKNIITEAGLLSVSAMSGKEAVDKARTEKPQLILMDIVMPGMDGYEACRTLTSDPTTKHIPIYFVSSKNQKADHLWAKMQGARALIPKPANKEHILEVIKLASVA